MNKNDLKKNRWMLHYYFTTKPYITVTAINSAIIIEKFMWAEISLLIACNN